MLFSLLTPLLITAYNTMQGLGEDTQATGQAINNQAYEEKKEDAHGAIRSSIAAS